MEGNSELKNLLGEKMLTNDGEKITEITFNDWYTKFQAKGQYVCFYFGAHWAPPSRIFTKSLNE